MIHRIFTITTIFILFVLSINCSKKETTEETMGENVFKYIQLINIRPEANEIKIINIFNEFNQIIAELGHKNIKFQIWKLKSDEEQQKNYKYLIEVTLSDQKTYDMIENSQQYKEVVEKYQEYMAMTIVDLYNQQYVPLN